MKKFKIGLVGCGLIGSKRVLNLGSKGKLVACTDVDITKSKVLAKKFNAEVYLNWHEMIYNADLDILIVATTHNHLAKIAFEALKADLHVFVEKPGGINSLEISEVLKLAKTKTKKVRVGYNHRYHPAIQKAKDLISKNKIGELMFLKASYGHGGRLGYEREWRSNKSISGGGELIDQGSHLIDLCHMFFGKLEVLSSVLKTYFWSMDVEDNCFMILTNKHGNIAQLNASCTEWKNTFELSIYGTTGKLKIEGLGRSYGTEKITYYKMSKLMGPPETIIWEFPQDDVSWLVEFNEFYKDIERQRDCIPGLLENISTMKIIEDIYKMNTRNGNL